MTDPTDLELEAIYWAADDPWTTNGLRAVYNAGRDSRADLAAQLQEEALVRFTLSDGQQVTDPDEAESLGLTVEAKRLAGTEGEKEK